MARQNSIATLSIANGQTKSGTIQGFWVGSGGLTHPGVVALDNAASITIKAPAALTAVVTVQVAFTEPSVDADFVNYQASPGVDLVIAAGKSITFPAPACRDLRLISAGAEGAQRDFVVAIQEDLAD